MPEETKRPTYNWDDEDTEEVKSPEKKSRDKVENARRDILGDASNSHRGMDDDNEPHDLAPRERDLRQTQINKQGGIQQHAQPPAHHNQADDRHDKDKKHD